MWKFVVLSFILISWTTAQNPGSRPFDNGHGWDIRLAVPGEPGRDYPTLNSIPKTSFSCSGKEPGYYADTETDCQVFRVCTLGSTYGFQSFLCPNGTLFNQAVFVCDWWMKVNCKKSGELYKINNEKYGNLKLGPQFMTNIKKMITHPMRNPYEEIYTKNQLIVTQEYNPSQSQLYNNKYLNSAYFQAKQTQTSQYQDIYSTADTLLAASTPSIQYSSNFSIFRPTDHHNILGQKHYKSYVLPNRTGIAKNVHILNSHSRQISQPKNIDIYNYNVNRQLLRPTQNYQRNIEPSKPQENDNINLDYKGGNQIFSNNKSKKKHTEFGIEFAKQQLNRNIKQDRALNADNNSKTRHSKTVIEVGNKTKQNLVSNQTPPAIITKTLAFRRLIKDPTNGNPKSRITFKTWILRPSKNSKLIIEPTPYTYHRSSNLLENVLVENSNVNKPEIQAREVKTENSYVYNAPTVTLDNEIITISQDQSAKLDSVTTSQPEISISYIPPTALPTNPSSINLIPTTFKPSSLLYIPPAESEKQIDRQYLLPLIENSKFDSISSSPRPFLTSSKQTQVKTNQNSLAFSDILTKEKLDITVDKIVMDTNDVLETASPEEFRYVKQDIYSADYPFDNYLHLDSDLDTQSDEKLTLQPPPLPLPKNSRLIATPSSKLEPPIEFSLNLNQMKNAFVSRLPFYEESTRRPNIIERTITLKITIPENITHILFTNSTISNSDTLEILKTDNTNNWVVINKVNKGETDVTPIGKLIWNKNSNISNTQDLVFSLLVDSINAAKQYNNIAQQNIVSPTLPTLTQPQFQNEENEKLQQISKDISRLTSSQFSPTNSSTSFRLANHGKNFNSLSKDATKVTTKTYVQKQILQQQKLIPTHQNIQKQVLYSLPGNNGDRHVEISSDQLYSGQLYRLPVPIVTKEIYNSPFPANFKLPTQGLTFDKNGNLIDDINHSKVDVETIKSRNLNNIQFAKKPTEAIIDQGSSANAVINTLKLPQNSITAQLQDNIVGTLPYLQDENKIIKYKKDKTYYIYSHLNDDNDQTRKIQNIVGNNLANKVPQNERVPQLSTFQLIPSLSYTLQNEKEKENILKTFQLNEYRNPKQAFSDENANPVRREDAITNLDYVVEQPQSTKTEKPIVLQSLYDGPNSYSTPQRSVINSIEQQNGDGLSNFNSKIEKFDTNEDTNNYGYPRIIPAKRFLF